MLSLHHMADWLKWQICSFYRNYHFLLILLISVAYMENVGDSYIKWSYEFLYNCGSYKLFVQLFCTIIFRTNFSYNYFSYKCMKIYGDVIYEET
jgi:hypothetical protein